MEPLKHHKMVIISFAIISIEYLQFYFWSLEKKESELSTVQPLSYSQDKVFLSDRYNSGGPLQFRGFSLYGISAVRANHLTSGGSLSGDSLGEFNYISQKSCQMWIYFQAPWFDYLCWLVWHVLYRCHQITQHLAC